MQNVLKIIKKYEIYPKKSLGQNFLINPIIIKKIVEKINPKDKEIFEIGPGLGSLSFEILNTAKSLIAYEIDQEMVEILKKELTFPNVEIINDDFLNANFDWEGQKIIVGNIPYYITGKIVFKIFESSQKFNKAVLMVQQDVADKLTSKVNSKKYGKLTVACEYFGGFKKLFNVSKKDFYPEPSVDSAVVEINFSKKFIVAKEREFLNFLKLSFFARRKMLINNLKREFDTEKLNSIFKKLNIPEKIRAQELDIKLFIKLWEELIN